MWSHRVCNLWTQQSGYKFDRSLCVPILSMTIVCRSVSLHYHHFCNTNKYEWDNIRYTQCELKMGKEIKPNQTILECELFKSILSPGPVFFCKSAFCIILDFLRSHLLKFWKLWRRKINSMKWNKLQQNTYQEELRSQLFDKSSFTEYCDPDHY